MYDTNEYQVVVTPTTSEEVQPPQTFQVFTTNVKDARRLAIRLYLDQHPVPENLKSMTTRVSSARDHYVYHVEVRGGSNHPYQTYRVISTSPSAAQKAAIEWFIQDASVLSDEEADFEQLDATVCTGSPYPLQTLR